MPAAHMRSSAKPSAKQMGMFPHQNLQHLLMSMFQYIRPTTKICGGVQRRKLDAFPRYPISVCSFLTTFEFITSTGGGSRRPCSQGFDATRVHPTMSANFFFIFVLTHCIHRWKLWWTVCKGAPLPFNPSRMPWSNWGTIPGPTEWCALQVCGHLVPFPFACFDELGLFPSLGSQPGSTAWCALLVCRHLTPVSSQCLIF